MCPGVYLKQNLKTTLLLVALSLSRLHHASTFSPAKAGCDLYLVRVRVRLILRFGFGFGFWLPFGDQLLEVAGSQLPHFQHRDVLFEQVEELVVWQSTVQTRDQQIGRSVGLTGSSGGQLQLTQSNLGSSLGCFGV